MQEQSGWTRRQLPQLQDQDQPPVYSKYALCRGLQRDIVYLSWPKTPLIYEPNGGGERELRGLSKWVELYTGAQMNFGDLDPYLTYGIMQLQMYIIYSSIWGRGGGGIKR